MPQPSHIKRKEKLPPPGDAWRAAEAAGVDMSLLEHSLSLTVWERMVEHQRALDLMEMLQNAKIKPQASGAECLAEPANTNLPASEKSGTL